MQNNQVLDNKLLIFTAAKLVLTRVPFNVMQFLVTINRFFKILDIP